MENTSKCYWTLEIGILIRRGQYIFSFYLKFDDFINNQRTIVLYNLPCPNIKTMSNLLASCKPFKEEKRRWRARYKVCWLILKLSPITTKAYQLLLLPKNRKHSFMVSFSAVLLITFFTLYVQPQGPNTFTNHENILRAFIMYIKHPLKCIAVFLCFCIRLYLRISLLFFILILFIFRFYISHMISCSA